MRGAAAIQFSSKYANIAVQLVLTAVLARLISPAEFGVASIVTVVTAFFTTFSDAGIGVAVIQFDDLTERDFGGLFCFSALLGACLAGLFALVSIPVASFYGDASLGPLCRVASLSLFLSTLNMVPNGLMLRERRFRQVGRRLITATAASGAVAVAAALLGAGSLAVVIQSVTLSGTSLLLNLRARPLREVNRHFVMPLRRVFSYSAYQLGFNVVNYLNRSLSNLLLGKALGTAALGNYDKAYKLTTYPMMAFSSVVGSVVQPFMARHQDDLDAIFSCFIRIEKAVSLVAAPVAALFFCAPDEIVGIMYGPQWSAAVEPFRIMGVSVYFQMLGNPTGAFFQSLGRTDIMFRQGILCTALTVGGLLAGLAVGGLDAVSAGIALGFGLQMLPIMHFLVRRAFGRSLGEMRVLLPEVLIGIVAAAACTAMTAPLLLPPTASLAVKAAILLAIFGSGYAVTGQFAYLRGIVGR